MKHWLGVCAVALAAAAVGCGGGSDESGASSESGAPSEAAADPSSGAGDLGPALLDPTQANKTAPDRFRVRVETTRGPFTVEVVRSWAPRGADRFYNLVELGYYDDVAFFRVLDGFVAQFGIHGDPQVSDAWRDSRFPDDPVVESNVRGTLTFATGGADTRTTQLFINFADNTNLDSMGFSPFARVIEGMEVVDSLYSGYVEGVPQGRLQAEGNEYLRAQFDQLDYVRRARAIQD